jgi:drug/metabolite transporter (DMT)-like permease
VLLPACASACLCFAVIAWGGSFVAARLLLHPSPSSAVALSPTLLAARFSRASICFIVALGRARVQRRMARGDLLRLAGLGLLPYTVSFCSKYTGVQQTSASVASILVVGPIPLARALLARLTGTGQLKGAKAPAPLLGFIGVSIVALRQSLAGLVGNVIVLALYSILIRSSFDPHSILSKRWMRAISPIVVQRSPFLRLPHLRGDSACSTRWSSPACPLICG